MQKKSELFKIFNTFEKQTTNAHFMKKFCYVFTLLAFVLLTSCGEKDWSEIAGPRAIEKELTHGQSAIFNVIEPFWMMNTFITVPYSPDFLISLA